MRKYRTKSQRLAAKWRKFKRLRQDMLARESRHLPGLIAAYEDGLLGEEQALRRKVVLVPKNPVMAAILRKAHQQLLAKVSRL